MIHQILFPFDFSDQGLQAAPFVRDFARRFDASVTVLSVVPLNLSSMPVGMGDDVAGWTRTLALRLDQALTAELEGVSATRVVSAGDPGERIAELAHERRVDLIMMPTHGLGLFRSLLVGSTTSKVLHDAACPVWTAAHVERQQKTGLPRRLLCAVDAQPETVALLDWAAEFATRVGASLTILHVVRPIGDWPTVAWEAEMQEDLRQAAHARIALLQAEARVKAPMQVAVGEIAATIAERAREEDADLILIGRGSVQAALGRLRTHAYGIIQRSPCPVLSV